MAVRCGVDEAPPDHSTIARTRRLKSRRRFWRVSRRPRGFGAFLRRGAVETVFDAACVEGPADLQYLIMRTIPLAEAFPLTSVTWRDEPATTLPKLLRPEEALEVYGSTWAFARTHRHAARADDVAAGSQLPQGVPIKLSVELLVREDTAEDDEALTELVQRLQTELWDTGIVAIRGVPFLGGKRTKRKRTAP